LKTLNLEVFYSKNFFNRILKYVIAILVIFIIILIMFRGSYKDGMEYDEIYSTVNIVPIVNHNAEYYNSSIFNIRMLGHDIPIMYKEYISSVSLLPYFPIAFFKDYLAGIRTLHLLYFFLSIAIFFMIFAQYDFIYSFVTAVLMSTSPIFFPAARCGFADPIHIALLAIAVLFIYKFFKQGKKLTDLFLAGFILFFTANLGFYFVWDITGMAIAGILLFPDYCKTIFGSLKNIAILTASAVIGLLNFVIYNIGAGFPTIKPLILKIFFPSEYNKQPIDYKASLPFAQDIAVKMGNISDFFAGYANIYYFIIIAMSCVYGFLIYWLISKKKIMEYRLYIFSFICFWLILIMILISPNSTRAGHYVYLIPFMELSMVSLVILLNKFYNSTMIRMPGVIFLVFVAVLNIFVSNIQVSKIVASRGTGNFSPAIFDLRDYINDKKIDSKDIVFLDWGMQNQIYFLNKGNFKINSLVFELMNKTGQEQYKILKAYLISKFGKDAPDALYFPFYSREDSLRDALVGLVNFNGGKIEQTHLFNETDGEEIISLYKLENVKEFVGNLIKNHKVFSGVEKLIVSYDFLKPHPGMVCRGVYLDDDNRGGKWAKRSSSYLFKYSGEYSMKIYTWFVRLENYDKKNINLEIYVNNQLVLNYAVRKNGENVIQVPLKNIKGKTLEIGIKSNSLVAAKNQDKRELAFIVSKIVLQK